MSSYELFASYYDLLTDNVDYAARGAYLHELLLQYGIADGLLLDLACGTGSLSVQMAQYGYDVIGVDISPAMLCEAQQKAADAEKNILFLCQPMQQLDLYGTVRAVICTLDSLNHLTDPADLEETIRRAALFTEPGGVFLFDVNTPYKHRSVLADNTFVFETDDVYCVWQNEPLPNDTVQITLDFFEKENDAYYRSTEQFCERAYSLDTFSALLQKYGFTVAGVWEELTETSPKATTQRVQFAAIKNN